MEKQRKDIDGTVNADTEAADSFLVVLIVGSAGMVRLHSDCKYYFSVVFRVQAHL